MTEQEQSALRKGLAPYLPVWEAQQAQMKEQVRRLGEVIGYGNMMHLAAECWEEMLAAKGYPAGGSHRPGPCRALTVDCGCKHGCDWCGGSGWLTRHVKAVKDRGGEATMNEAQAAGPLPCWADLQILGHVRHVCYLSEVEMAGAKFLKVEPVNPYDGTAEPVRYYPPSSVYSIQPVPEEEIRSQIERQRQATARRQALLAPPAVTAVTEEPDEDEYDERDGVGDDHDDIPV